MSVWYLIFLCGVLTFLIRFIPLSGLIKFKGSELYLKVINLIPDSYANNLHLLKRNVANTFLGELALKHNLVVVPYFEGVGVGNKIRGKYADQSEAFLLEIPEPTYFIDFNLPKSLSAKKTVWSFDKSNAMVLPTSPAPI